MIYKESIPYMYEYFSLEKLRNVLRECPVAVMPTGSLEWHGEQNALGLDAHTATYVVEKAISLLGNGAILPTNYAGTYGWSRMEGCFVFDNDLVEELFFQYFREMIKIGFKVCIIITGHWGDNQTTALRNASERAQKMAEKINPNNSNARCLGFRLIDLVHDDRYGHAQTMETSCEMAIGRSLNLELVNINKVKKGNQNLKDAFYPKYNPKAPENDPIEFNWDTNLSKEEYCNADIGAQYMQRVSQALALEILEHFDELKIEYKTPHEIPYP